MALPQNPLSDIQIHNTLKTQNDNLSAQTKVLHKLSDSIMDQRKEFAELRKDIRNSQREFFQGNQQGMSSIQKYFEKYKSDNKSKSKEESSSTGFFKSAINKLFGPSKYQQKMMEETTRIRELTETSAISLNFLRQANEEGPRRRERELLAKAIAEKLGIEIKDSQGDSGGGGLLSGIISTVLQGGTLLVTFVGTVVVPILTGIITTLGTVGAAIVGAVTALGEMLLTAMGLNKMGGMGGGPGDVERNRNQNGRAGGGRMGPNGLPELEGPRQPRDMGTLRQNRAGAYVPEGAGMSTGNKVGIAAAIASVLGLGYAAYNGKIGEYFSSIKEENLAQEKQDQGKTVEDKLKETWSGIKKFFSDPMAEAEKKDQENAEKKLENQTDMLGDYTKKMNESIKKMLKDFEDLPKNMEKAVMDKLVDAKDFVVDQLNQLGEINFGTDTNPQKINLLPGLGNAVWDTLKEAYDETEAMTNKLTPNAQMFSQSITQNVTNGGVPTISAAQITAEGTGTKMMDMFRTRRGLR